MLVRNFSRVSVPDSPIAIDLIGSQMIEDSFRDQFKHNFEANLVYATLAQNSRPTNESVDYASSPEHRLGLGTGTANQDAICLDALPVWRTGTQASNVSSLSIRTARMARVQS